MVRIFAFVSSTRLIYVTLCLKPKISKIIYIYIYISFSEALLFLISVNGTYVHAVYSNRIQSHQVLSIARMRLHI